MEDEDEVWDEDFINDGINLLNRPSMTNLISPGSLPGLHISDKQHSQIGKSKTTFSANNETISNKQHTTMAIQSPARPILAQYYLRQESENFDDNFVDVDKINIDEIPNVGLDGLELEDHINDTNEPLNLKLLESHHGDVYRSRYAPVAEDALFDDEDDFDQFRDDGQSNLSMEEEEDEDWDKDLDIQLPPTKKPEASQRAVALSGIRGGPIQSSESLLEYVEASVRERMSRNGNHDDAFIPPEVDDAKKHELQNQRLKGLTEWLKSTSRALRSTINKSNSTDQCNARILMEEEIRRVHADVSSIEQIVEKCEEEPTKESCILSLEIVVKWIRGVCHGLDHDSEQEELAPSSSHNTRTTRLFLYGEAIPSEKLDQLFLRCDYILNEQSRATVAKILEYVRVLREEQVLLRFPDVHNYTGKRGSVIPDFLKVLCNKFSLCRIQLYMMEIKSHVNTVDNLISHLECLETIMEELETLGEWLENLALFLPPSDLTNAVSLRNHFKHDADVKMLVIEKTRVALTNRLTHSFYHHQYRLHHAEALHALLMELQALCLSNKMLLLANLSPISMQIRKSNKVESSNLHRPVRALFRNATRNNRSLIQDTSYHALNSHSSGTAGIGVHGGSRPKLEESSVYNVVYETNIGSLFVTLMVSLESPSIIRSRLAFAACCYIQALQKDQLPWQSGKYSKVIREKRDVEGVGALRRSNSEVTFGIEEVDMQYNLNEFSIGEFERSIVETFSQSLGPIDELKNLQVLLFEGAVDLFPTLQKLEENFNSLSYRSSVLFPHVTASLDLDLSFEAKILKNDNGFTGTHHSSNSSTSFIAGQYPIVNGTQASAGNSPTSLNFLAMNRSMGDFKVGSVDGTSSYNGSHHNSVDVQPAGNFSSLLKYELYLYSFALLSQFVTSISDSYPSIAVELLEFSTVILAHLNNVKERRKFHKQALLLAIRCGDCEAAIKHGNILWQEMLNSKINTTTTNSATTNISELIYTAEILGEQFATNAQYELAVKVYGNAVRKCYEVVKAKSAVFGQSKSSRRLGIHRFNKHIELKLEGILLNLGKAYLEHGSTHYAIKVFKRVLMDSTEKPDCIRNDEKKIIFLSWILKAFYELRDFDSCKRTIDVMKEVRKRNIHSLLDHLSSLGFEKAFGDKRSNGLDDDSNGGHFDKSNFQNKNFKANGVISQRYLMNNSVSSLPQFVINAHNIDLGVMLSKICCKTGQYVSALHTLTPAIICAEMVVGGKSGTKEGMLELGNLYYLRGKIELEACRSAQSITYPFEIGSNQLFAAVQLLCADFVSSSAINKSNRSFYRKDSSKARESGIKAANRRSHASSVGFDGAEGGYNKTPNQMHIFTCRKTAVYNDAADLLWDAMKWFRRAWDLFHAAGDEISAARSANRIAECHLLPSFVPHAFFGVPLEMALDLSNYKGGDPKFLSSPHPINSPDKLSPHPPKGKLFGHPSNMFSDVTSPVGHSTGNILKRFASLEEVERVTSFAYDLHLDASLPVELMESFMNLAEMHLLQGNTSVALPFWWEAKDLFLFFFSDGSLVPIVRRSPQSFVEKLNSILDRIVRFLWKCEETIRNNHLILLEMHNTFKLEQIRAKRYNIERSRTVAQRLLGVYRALIKKGKSSGTKAVAKISPIHKQVSVPTKKTAKSKKKQGFFANFCGCGASQQSIDNVIDPLNHTAINEEIDVSQRKHSKGDKVILIVRPFSDKPCIGKDCWDLIEEFTPLFNQSDRMFCWRLNDEVVLDKHMDFGWNNFVDYTSLIPPPVNPTSKKSFMSTSFYQPNEYGQHRDKSLFISANLVDQSFQSPLEVIEYFCVRSWIFKYHKIPPFLLSHIVSERDLLPLEDPEKSDSDDESISNPSSFTDGGSKVYSVASSRPTADDSSSAQPFHLGDPNRPLDPFADFDWMAESFASYYVPPLLEDPEEVKASFVFLPELSELALEKFIGDNQSKISIDDAKTIVKDATFHKNLAIKSEKVLIQRIWSLFAKARNSCTLYRNQKMNLLGLKRQIRLSLSSIAMNTLRLRTFSRQFKSSIYCYDLLTSMLLNNNEFYQEPKLSFSLDPSKNGNDKFRAMKLQERLPQAVYVHYIDKVLFAYNPYSGSEYIQMLGSNSCTKFSHALNMAIAKAEMYETMIKDGDDAATSNDTAGNSHYSFAHDVIGIDQPPHSPPGMPNYLKFGVNAGIAMGLEHHFTDFQKEVIFSPKETSMMFALCTKDKDSECAGGPMGRFKAASLMKKGAICGLIEFLRTFGQFSGGQVTSAVESMYGNISNDGNSLAASNNKSVVKSLYFQEEGHNSGVIYKNGAYDERRPSLSALNESFIFRPQCDSSLLSDPQSQGDRSVKDKKQIQAPLHPIPVTLFCSYPTNIIPWEILLEECRVVRAFGLASLLSQVLDRKTVSNGSEDFNNNVDSSKNSKSSTNKHSIRSSALSPKVSNSKNSHMTVRGYLGPSLNQKPLFITVGYGIQQLGEMSERQLRQRKAKASLHIIDYLDHNCNHIIREEMSLKPVQQDKNAWRSNRNEIVDVVRNTSFPLASKINAESSSSLGNAPNCTLLVSADSKSLGVKNFWSQVDVKIDELKSTANKEYPKTSGDDMHMLAPDGYFPVVLFSYCDLMELSDSVIAGTCLLRRDSIFVFAPQCIQDKLLMELKIALERWCRVDRSNDKNPSAKSLLLMNSYHNNNNSFGSVSSDQFISLTHASHSSTFIPRGQSNLNVVSTEANAFKGSSRLNQVPTAASTSSHDLNESFGKSGDSDIFPMLQPNNSGNEQGSFISRTYANTVRTPQKVESQLLLPSHDQKYSQPSSEFGESHSTASGLKSKDRTWAYHIIMDVVQKMQRDHAVPIPVIM